MALSGMLDSRRGEGSEGSNQSASVMRMPVRPGLKGKITPVELLVGIHGTARPRASSPRRGIRCAHL